MSEKNIKVGIGVMILKNGKVLLSKRKSSHGAGEYGFPGGHLEFGESIVAAAKRETKEEAGIEIKNVRFLYFGNLIKYAGKHYAQIGIIAEYKSGRPTIMEPDKSDSWGWYDTGDLPEPLFGPIPMYFEAYKSGKNFFDSSK